jgi:protein-tyrosine phosphatase
MHPDRHVALEGASNFRDLGGYRAGGGQTVKWRRLYRSDHLNALTVADCAQLDERGIRLVFDLRRQSETLATPTRWMSEQTPELIHAPLFTDETAQMSLQRVAADEAARHDPKISSGIMREMYVRMVSDEAPRAMLGRIFERIAEPGGLPALIHCAGGKDRTGVACALILGVLGVSEGDIIEDFMLTQTLYDASGARRGRIAQVVAGAEAGFWSEAALVPLFNVQRDHIEAALAVVAEKGGFEAFLTGEAGVAPRTLERLREMLLD